MRQFFLILLALTVGAGLGHFGSDFVMAANRTEWTFPAPDPDAKFVKPPRAWQSYACDPLASANVFDDRFDHRATVWTKYEASKVAIQVSDDGKRLSVMRANDVAAGSTQPEDFKITLNNNSYICRQKAADLGRRFANFRRSYDENGCGRSTVKVCSA